MESGGHLEFLRHFEVLFLNIHMFFSPWSELPKYVIRSKANSAQNCFFNTIAPLLSFIGGQMNVKGILMLTRRKSACNAKT
jgi:hypothetical protein